MQAFFQNIFKFPIFRVKIYEKSRFFVWFASGYRNPKNRTLLERFGQVLFDNLDIKDGDVAADMLDILGYIVLGIGAVLLGLIALFVGILLLLIVLYIALIIFFISGWLLAIVLVGLGVSAGLGGSLGAGAGMIIAGIVVGIIWLIVVSAYFG